MPTRKDFRVDKCDDCMRAIKEMCENPIFLCIMDNIKYKRMYM